MRSFQILQGDARERLSQMESGAVQTCVTSPPYFGLRDYGMPGQVGLESSPEEYAAKLVEIFREVKRVLRDDGTLWLNLGDSYCNTDKWGGGKNGNSGKHTISEGGGVPSWACRQKRPAMEGIKPKDLVGIPWLVAFALRADGWYLRSDIIWNKPNPMPESVTDRPTKAHEYIFLLSKSQTYFYDADAIKEPATQSGKVISLGEKSFSKGQANGLGIEPSGNGKASKYLVPPDRNKRSVWTVTPSLFPEAHFATFPPELIKPCILAGSRGGGQRDTRTCASCGGVSYADTRTADRLVGRRYPFLGE